MLWVDRLLAGASAVQSLSWSLACPFHCGPNSVLVALLGFLCGLLVGLGLALALWISLKPSWDSSSPQHPSSSVPTGPLRRRSQRLGGYLHE